MSSNPESLKAGIESTVETQNAAAERSAELSRNRFEKNAEKSPESQAGAIEKARREANKEAVMSKERGGSEKKSATDSPTIVRKVTKKHKEAVYKKTLKEIQSQMTPRARSFSKIIHVPLVEKTSDVIGNTIARPTAILAGSTTAFVVVTLVFLVAKHYGYVLSGFESIGAFIAGWFIGTLYDATRSVFQR